MSLAAFNAPDIDYAGLSPIIALTGGLVLVLLTGLIGRRQRALVSAASFIAYGATVGLVIWQFGEEKDLVSGALRLDELGLVATLISILCAVFVIPLSWREEAADRAPGPGGHGEFQALLIASVLGMALLSMAQNLVIFFVGLELLSVPLYVLCGSALRRQVSLEAGLKYLIVGSLGSATLLYGLAFIYGGSGSTDFSGIREGIGAGLADDPLILIGIALTATGLAFKLSIAPFHQWTPDVYQGAPTPVTAFMAVATKAAAFAVLRAVLPGRAGPGRRRLAACTRRPRGGLDRGRQRRRPDPELAQAPPRLFRHRAGRVHAGGDRRGERGRHRGALLLSDRLRVHESRRLCRDHDQGARDGLRRRHPLGPGAGAGAPGAGLAAHDRDARPGGAARDRGVHRQALSDRGLGGCGLHLARRDDRRGHDDLSRLLPAGDRRGLDAPRVPL